MSNYILDSLDNELVDESGNNIIYHNIIVQPAPATSETAGQTATVSVVTESLSNFQYYFSHCLN